MHLIFGAIFLLPLMLLPADSAAKVLIMVIGLAAFLHWYITRRRLREKYFKEFIKTLELPTESHEAVIQRMKDVKRFEEWIISSAFRSYFRREESPMLSTLYFLIATLFTLLLFGTSYAVIALVTLSVGDAFSTVTGKRFGKNKLPYNKDKSLQGTLAFFITSFAALQAFFMFFPQYALFNQLYVAFLAAFFGALIETIPTIDDNVTIPLGVSAVLWLSLLLL